MNKHLKSYFNSFKLKKEYWHTLLIDTGFLAVIGLIVFLFGYLIKRKSEVISQGQSIEQIQQMLLSMQPEQAQAFSANLQGFVATFVIGAIVILVGGLFLYSLSRKLIWDYLLKKKVKKTYWRWNLLNLVLIIPVVIYLFAFGIIRLLLGYLVSLFNSQIVLNIFYGLANLFLLFILFIFVFLVYYSFAKEYKVWESIGKAFNLIKIKWKSIWPMFLLITGTAIVLSLILWPIGKLLVYQPSLLIGINLVISLLFCVWMRIYTFKTIKNQNI